MFRYSWNISNSHIICYTIYFKFTVGINTLSFPVLTFTSHKCQQRPFRYWRTNRSNKNMCDSQLLLKKIAYKSICTKLTGYKANFARCKCIKSWDISSVYMRLLFSESECCKKYHRIAKVIKWRCANAIGQDAHSTNAYANQRVYMCFLFPTLFSRHSCMQE